MADLGTVNEKIGIRKRRRATDLKAIRKLVEIKQRLLAKPGHISEAGVKFISEFEGFFAEPYNDPAGHATVGFGQLLHLGAVTSADRRGVWIKGQETPGRLTKEEGQRLLKIELARVYEPAVLKLFRHGGPLAGKWSQTLHDALTSFAFNLGPGAVTPGTRGFETVGRAITSRSPREIANALLLYDRAGGVPWPGLTRRRRAERRLILTGSYKTD